MRKTEPSERARRHVMTSAIAALMCTACAPMRTAPPPPPPPAAPPPTTVYVPMLAPEDMAARRLLAYQESLSKMNPSEWPKEASRLGDGSGSLEDAMKLALVLGHTHAGVDLARAQSLLDAVLANNSFEGQAWHGLARMLSNLLAEQRRSEEMIDKLNQQLRDTQRENQRKLDQLNEKLEALKSIERSLNARAPAAALPPTPPAATVKTAPRP